MARKAPGTGLLLMGCLHNSVAQTVIRQEFHHGQWTSAVVDSVVTEVSIRIDGVVGLGHTPTLEQASFGMSAVAEEREA